MEVDLWGNPIKQRPKTMPSSTAERVAKSVAKRAEIGPLPEVVDESRREEACRSLISFGMAYATATEDWPGLLEREPSDGLRDYATTLQSGIEGAGLLHVRLARASGKTTWAKLAIAWGVATGRIRFAVVVGANGILANAILADIYSFFELSPHFAEDFPAVSYPIKCLEGKVQRAAVQTLNGARTLLRRTADLIQLATVPGEVSSAGCIIAKGAGAAVRGLVVGGRRPDFVMLDDIQTREDACSAMSTAKLCDWVRGDILGLGGARQLSAVMSSTPIMTGDVSEHFADSSLEPAWRTISRPMVEHWPERMDLWQIYCDRARDDMLAGDSNMSVACEFYREHAADLERGAVLFDPGNFDERIEASATQHAFNLLVRSGEAAFQAEYMLNPPKLTSVVELRTEQVAEAVNGAPRLSMPRGTMTAIAFIDVMATGLHYCVTAFGPGQVGAVIDYGRYPERGRLVPEGVATREQERLVASGLSALLDRLFALPLRDADGGQATLHAVWLDHRFLRKTVATIASLFRTRKHANVWTCAGFDSVRYKNGDGRHVIAKGEGVDFRELDGIRFAAQNSDHWKESAQRAFLAPPLSPGSVSLWGSDARTHLRFADQITSERLADKAMGAHGELYRWNLRPGSENHWLDCLSGTLAAASWYRVWDASDVAPSVVSAAASQGNTSSLAKPRAKRIVSGRPVRRSAR